MRKLYVILIVACGCQQLKPESVSIPQYPDYLALMTGQVELLRNSGVEKHVWLEGKSETKILKMDSASWAKELSFLKEINPNQPEYVGAFEISGDGSNKTLTLADGENGALKSTSFIRHGAEFKRISATFHEDKDVYVHHREIELNFIEGVLNSLSIDGYQKMMFKDTVRFRIKVEVN